MKIKKKKIIIIINLNQNKKSKMKKLLLTSNPQYNWLKLDDQPRYLEHWVTVE